MSDRFDGDPDDFFEPDEESSLGPDNPAEEFEEGSLGTEAPSVPSPESPDVGLDSDAVMEYDDVDPGLRRRFWVVVFGLKLTLLSLTGGALFLFVEGNTALGGQLLGFGGLLAVYTVHRYRDAKAKAEEHPDNEEVVDESDNPDETQNPEAAEEEGSS